MTHINFIINTTCSLTTCMPTWLCVSLNTRQGNGLYMTTFFPQVHSEKDDGGLRMLQAIEYCALQKVGFLKNSQVDKARCTMIENIRMRVLHSVDYYNATNC